jgi:predicted ATPase
MAITLDGTNGITSPGGISVPSMHLQHQEAQNTDGGGITSGAWRTMTVNTQVTNTITGASLAANAITLPAGTYYLSASQNVSGTARSQARIRQTSGTPATLLTGISNYAGNIEISVSGFFTLASSQTIELQVQVGSTSASNGQGLADNFGTEVYNNVLIQRQAS